MSYKVVNGKIVNTKKRKLELGNAALGWQVDEKTRHIYMVRMRVDSDGRCYEENRTTFFQPGWLDFTQSEWEKHRDMMAARFNEICQNREGIHKLHTDNSPVKINVF